MQLFFNLYKTERQKKKKKDRTLLVHIPSKLSKSFEKDVSLKIRHRPSNFIQCI